MAKQKIADLPQEEQDKIIAEMKELQIGGVYAAYTVEKALAAIEKKKAKLANPDAADDDEQIDEGEQTTEENSDVPEIPEGSENPDETSNPEKPENSEELPEGLDEDAKEFLNGESDELPENAEEITEDKAKKLEKKAKKAQKSEGICHICRSKVYNGVCSGCGYSLRG